MGLLVTVTIAGLTLLLITLAVAEVGWNRLTGSRFLPWTRPRVGAPVAAPVSRR